MTKEHILAEIRRTAAENGGVALGQQRFLAETGIRKSDWIGKYWVRWGDALLEAGVPRNQFTSALPVDRILLQLAELVRELGRFPVEAELSLKARSDPTFPNRGTFRKRLGSKPSVVAKLRAFCLERGLQDVAALCPPAPAVAMDDVAPVREREPEYGSVYLMKSGRFHKIGHTNAVGRRERELAIQLPEKVRLVHSITTDDPAGIEEYWHKRFHDRRRNGEWFELAASDVAAFRRRKFM